MLKIKIEDYEHIWNLAQKDLLKEIESLKCTIRTQTMIVKMMRNSMREHEHGADNPEDFYLELHNGKIR